MHDSTTEFAALVSFVLVINNRKAPVRKDAG